MRVQGLRHSALTTIFSWLCLFSASISALEKSDLELIFEDDFESGMDGWTFSDPDNWRVEAEGDTDNHVLSLFSGGGITRDFFAPRSVAMVDGLTAGSFIFEARLRHRGKEYGHQDLCVVYNRVGDYQFYYTHLAPVADAGANTIFIVNDAERKSIAQERNDGIQWGDRWHDLRIVRDADTGRIEVFFEDMTRPIMVASDTTFGSGGIGLGSFNDIGDFDDIRIWAQR